MLDVLSGLHTHHLPCSQSKLLQILHAVLNAHDEGMKSLMDFELNSAAALMMAVFSCLWVNRYYAPDNELNHTHNHAKLIIHVFS